MFFDLRIFEALYVYISNRFCDELATPRKYPSWGLGTRSTSNTVTEMGLCESISKN